MEPVAWPLQWSCLTIEGIHHITAIAGDPQRNVDFYAGVLGLRLVKLTINFDDPGAYHLYYGDELGHPGSIMTFFPWPGAPRGRHGAGQASVTSFSVPENSLNFWSERLRSHGVEVDEQTRFDARFLVLTDPDGLKLELVASRDSREAWAEGPAPMEHAIRGFHHVTLSEEGYERTAALVAGTLGMRLIREEANRFRYAAGNGEPGALVDVLCQPDLGRGLVAVGTVHHVAWRTPTEESQKKWRREIAAQGYDVTPIIDRNYFHSIYFREPGGVLFEIATDPPGFTVDEPADQLGTQLKLPPWLEASRIQLERVLPKLRVPGR